eukprot:TRINITY_DN78318_c0_g1_i1.p1 TRINITY_DN78318_c0_g1~~TRINITY_DN78318_c0_g1_i1.p1  ORF type:complete len:223 (+),score=30.96 TRINITY_DN78318_c0_g1_i1:116-784(+)
MFLHTPDRKRCFSRSRTPPRNRRIELLGQLRGSRVPGRQTEDVYRGRLPSIRLLDVESCLERFYADRDEPMNVVVLCSGSSCELDAITQHFKRPLGTALAIDVCDWSSQVKPPFTFKQLDMRNDQEEVLAMLCDENRFPLENRLLVIASSVAVGHFADTLEEYLQRLPPNADMLMLEPMVTFNASRDGDILRKVAAEWSGFVYRGGPRLRACFCSRSEVVGA